MKVTVIVITDNDEASLGKCLESAKWADEIIVTDSFSSDATPAIAAMYEAQFFQLDIKSITVRRKYSIHKSQNEWILLLEPREIITDELKEEILSLPDVPEFAAYQINREIFHLGHKINHCGVNPNFQIRLFSKEFVQVIDGIEYEGINVNGSIKKLSGEIQCRTLDGLTGLIKKMNVDSSARSLELFEKGKSMSKAGAIMGAFRSFARTYIIRLGFLDGIAGFYISISVAATAFLTRLKLLKLLEKI